MFQTSPPLPSSILITKSPSHKTLRPTRTLHHCWIMEREQYSGKIWNRQVGRWTMRAFLLVFKSLILDTSSPPSQKHSPGVGRVHFSHPLWFFWSHRLVRSEEVKLLCRVPWFTQDGLPVQQGTETALKSQWSPSPNIPTDFRASLGSKQDYNDSVWVWKFAPLLKVLHFL